MSDHPEPDPVVGDPCADLDSGECREALAQLYSFLDGELTIERRTLITTHLDLCSPCGNQFSFEAELRQVVSMRCREVVPDELRLRIADALRREVEGT